MNEQMAEILVAILGNLVLLVCMTGAGLLVAWQIQTPLLSSLDRCPVRRNRLPLFFPFFQIIVWIVAMALINAILKHVLADRPENIHQFAQNLAMMLLNVSMSVFFILVAKFAFVRGLRGFGLRFRTIGRDIFWAAVNLIAAYPIILLVLWLTVQVGQHCINPEFNLEKHQSLTELDAGNPLWMRVFLMFVILTIVPAFEELLFRGLLQSAFTAYLSRPWAGIVLASIVFALMHPLSHFFGIFVLSCCLGYAYEKSGSLLRPIFIHIFFNTTSVLSAILFQMN